VELVTVLELEGMAWNVGTILHLLRYPQCIRKFWMMRYGINLKKRGPYHNEVWNGTGALWLKPVRCDAMGHALARAAEFAHRMHHLLT
jgi:hypothetical protein